jgi:hypothetical protein
MISAARSARLSRCHTPRTSRTSLRPISAVDGSPGKVWRYEGGRRRWPHLVFSDDSSSGWSLRGCLGAWPTPAGEPQGRASPSTATRTVGVAGGQHQDNSLSQQGDEDDQPSTQRKDLASRFHAAGRPGCWVVRLPYVREAPAQRRRPGGAGTGERVWWVRHGITPSAPPGPVSRSLRASPRCRRCCGSGSR